MTDDVNEGEDVLELSPDEEYVWGKERVEFCMDCLLTHEVASIYSCPNGNPMYATWLCEMWLCDDEDDDLWEDDGE